MNGATVYSGPSMLDGSRIHAVLTGTKRPSSNTKTGHMAQLWILPDMHPATAVKTGADASVCGTCPRRPSLAAASGLTPCYVTTVHAPLAVWRAHTKAPYPDVAIRHPYPVRLGAWGDPAALPLDALQRAIATGNGGWTGYTHVWRSRPDLRPYLMASCDTQADHDEAVAAGWRTFLIRSSADVPLPTGTIACPASAEAGQRTTCAQCRLCNGATPGDRRKSIVIIAH